MAERDLTEATLFVALTRPAMKWGVPYIAYLYNLFGSAAFGILMGAPPYMLVGLIIHYVMREMTKRDHNLWRQWWLWLNTKAKTVDGSPLSPLPWRITHADMMGSAV
jgi:type IV secretion system protein VirB3